MAQFAFTVADEALPKLAINSFPDSSEYLGQLVMRLYKWGASKVEINSTEDSCSIEADCIIGEEELELIKNLRTSIRALPYFLVFRYFKDFSLRSTVEDLGITILDNGNNNGLEFQPVDPLDYSESKTIITLNQRRSEVDIEDEQEYCHDKFRFSDLEVIINNQNIDEDLDQINYTYEFTTEVLEGKIIIGEQLHGQRFYYRGREIVEKDFSLPHILIILNKHSFSPIVSCNNIESDSKKQEEYLAGRNQVVNQAIQQMLEETDTDNKLDEIQNLIQNIVIANYESDEYLLSESTLQAIRNFPLCNMKSGNRSFKELHKYDGVYLNEDDFYEVVANHLSGSNAYLNKSQALVYRALGGKVIEPSDVPIYEKFSKMKELPENRRWRRKYLLDTTLLDMEVSSKQEVDKSLIMEQSLEITSFLSSYNIHVVPSFSLYTTDNLLAFVEIDDVKILNLNNPQVVSLLSQTNRFKASTLPIVYHLLSQHYSVPENQYIGSARRKPEALVDHVFQEYLNHII